MPASPAQSRLGQQIQHNGHTYELKAVRGGAHRWVRVDRDTQSGLGNIGNQSIRELAKGAGYEYKDGYFQKPSGEGPRFTDEGLRAHLTLEGSTADKATAQGDLDSNNGDDSAARHEFTRGQIKNVQGPARGIMAAFHEDPEVQNGGATVTKAFAPEQAKQAHDWLTRNAGKTLGDGQVVDLGGGKMGYSTPAGAIIIWPADASGKHQVKFTNQTGPVSRAMRGGQAAVSQPPPVNEANPVPPPVQGKPVAAQAGGGENPFAQPEDTSGRFTNRLTPEAASAVGGIMDKPEAAQQPAAPSTPRAAADEAKQRLSGALDQWKQEVAGGLTPKGNARWRSYTAALRSIWQQHEQLARDWEKRSKGGGKSKGQAPGAADDEVAAMEAEIAKRDPEVLKSIKEITQRPDSYRDLLSQYLDAVDPDRAKKPTAKPESHKPLLDSPSPRSESPQWRHAGEAFKKPESKEQSTMERLGIDPRTGKRVSPKREIDPAEDLRKGFTTPPVEQPPESKLPAKQQKLAKLTDKYLDHFKVGTSDQNRAAIMKAIQSGHIASPKDLRTVLRTASKLHQRGNIAEDDHPALKESIRRKANREKRASYQSLVKSQAAEWDMKPEEYHSLAKEIYPDYIKHHEERETAKKHARELTGMTAREINRMENSGLDSASAKRFDTIGRELADNYPGIFGGTGYGDEADTDYGSVLWDLIREGSQKIPGKASKEFHQHVDEFLRSQLAGAKPSPSEDSDEDYSKTPFQKLAGESIHSRYLRWRDAASRLTFENT